MKNILLGCVGVVIVAAMCYAANDVQGQLKNVYGDFITIAYQNDVNQTFDINQKGMGELAVSIDSNTRYGNFSKLSDLKEGDWISVDYRMVGSKRIADRLTRLNAPALPSSDVHQVTTTTTTVTTP